MKDNVKSATANVVAQNLLLVRGNARRAALVTPEAAHLTALLVEAFSPAGRSFVKRSRERWFQHLRSAYERLTIPGLALHQALRKRHIERWVRASLLEGFTQLVVLGGGLDTLALRLSAEFPQVNFFELDHQATQCSKREVIRARHLTRANLHFIHADFQLGDWPTALAAASPYDATKRTLFLSEGVLMYLERRDVRRIFDAVRRQSNSRFIFTFMEPDERGRASFRRSTWLVRLWLHLRREPFRWGLKRDELESFLHAHGFALRELMTSEKFRDLYLRACGLMDAVLAEGENVCTCEVMSAAVMSDELKARKVFLLQSSLFL